MKKLKDMTDKEIENHLNDIQAASIKAISKVDYMSLLQDFRAIYQSDEIGLKKMLEEVFTHGQYEVYKRFENE